MADSGFGFTQNVAQVNNSTTFLKGNHAMKAGFDLQWVKDTRVSPSAQLYTFPTLAAYLAARSGENRLGYTNYQAYFGLPDLEYSTSQYGLFIQDDWRVNTDLKILYGVRYDYYTPPDADGNAPVATSREFPISKSNFAPRVGAVWTLGEDRRTVLRANTGLMYDQTLNAMYEQALQNDGTNARASVTFTPTQAGAPVFPAVLSAGAGATPNLAWTIDPEFKVAKSWQNNVQLERGFGDHYSHRHRRLVREGLQPAGGDEHQRDQPDRHAGRRPPDLQHRGQRIDAPRSALQRDQQRAVAW